MTTLLDTTLRREAQLLRFGTYLKDEYIKPTFQELSKELPKMLTGFDELNKLERTKLAREARNHVSTQMSAMFDDITGELHLLSDDEASFMLDLYDDYTTEAMKAVIGSAVVSTADNALISLESGGVARTGVWSDFIKDNINTTARMVDGAVLKGFRDGETLQSITQTLRGSYNRGTKQYVGGILSGRATQYAETLARTGISHYANQARDKFANLNSDLLGESVFFATLDNRTTTTCLGFHTNRYKNNDPKKPVLPLHYNERSIFLPAGPGIDPLEGNRPLVGGKHSKEAREEFEKRRDRLDNLRDERAERRAAGENVPTTASKVKYRGRKDLDVFSIEQVSAKVTSQTWLKRQPRFFVEDTLGRQRAKLFLDGDLPIEKFTDLGGKPLTLAELRKTAAGEKEFRKAGLD